MKKISIKISTTNIIMFFIIFGIVSIIVSNRTETLIQNSVGELIDEKVHSIESDFDALIQQSATYTVPYKSYLEENLTLDILKDDAKSKAVFKTAELFTMSTVRKNNLLDLYCWLDPNAVNNVFGMAVENFSLNRKPIANYPAAYSRSDMTGDSWEWFWGPKDNGTNITLPYDWEGIDGKVISYTESLVIDGKFVGVVGTDFTLQNFQNDLEAEKIYETGYFSILDENLNFIVHKEATGKKIDTWFTELTKEDLDSIINNGDGKGLVTTTFNGDHQVLSYKRLSNGWYILGIPTTSEIYRASRELTTLLFLVFAAALLLVAFISIVSSTAISKPVKQVAEKVKDISEGDGDLTQQLDVKSNDETRTLADSFNTFIFKLKDIVTSIKGSSERSESISSSLNISAADASSASIEINNNIESIHNQISKLNNNIQETTSGVEAIGSNINQFKTQVEDQVSAVEQSSASIEEMIASLENVSGITNKKLESTKLLVETTKRGGDILEETSVLFKDGIADKIGNIKEMVDVISGISDSTNLLAMNAAIEAAHAGDAGKGFAVVADEIRKMAEESAHSSSEISAIINSIVQAIVNTDSNIDKTARAFNDIDNEVKEIDTALNEIASNTVELATGGQEILKSVSLLNDTTNSIAGGIREIEVGAEEITSSMMNVQNISSEVTIGAEEITMGINHVSESFEKVAGLASELDEENKKLQNEVGKFIV